MRVLDPGHAYSMNTLDGDVDCTLQFVKRIGEKFPGNEGEPVAGTTCQEVLRVLINRVNYLQGQAVCEENLLIMKCLRDAIELFESRAARRHGKKFGRSREINIENMIPCPECGHIFDCDHMKEKEDETHSTNNK